MVYCQRTLALIQADLGSNLDLKSLAFLRLSFSNYKEPGTDGDKWIVAQCVASILEYPGSSPKK